MASDDNADVQSLFSKGGLDSKRRASISSANLDQFLEGIETGRKGGGGGGGGRVSERGSVRGVGAGGNRKRTKTPPGSSRLRERIRSYNEMPSPFKGAELPSLDHDARLAGLADDGTDVHAQHGTGPLKSNRAKDERNTISGENAEDFAAEMQRARRGSHHAMLGGRPGSPGQNDFGGPRVHRREHQVGMIRDLKIQRARETRRTLEEEEATRTLELIKAKEAATARVAYLRDPQVQARQEKLMAAIAAVRFAENLWAASRPKRATAPEDKKNNLAAAVIQRMHRSRKNLEMWQLAVRFVVRVHKCKPRLALAVRCWRRYRSADRLRAFLADHLSDAVKIKVLLYKFIRRVLQCQRAIRDFIACRDARLVVLRKVWDQQQAIYLKVLDKKGKNGAEDTKEAASPGSGRGGGGGGGGAGGKKKGPAFGQNTRQGRRSMTSSKSDGNLLGDALASLREIREGNGPAKVDKATRDETLRRLLKQQRTMFLEHERQTAMLRSPEQRGMGTRTATVAKVFNEKEVHAMLFADESVKKVENLVDTKRETHMFLLFQSFRNNEGSDAVSVIRAALKEAYAKMSKEADQEVATKNGRNVGHGTLAASPP